MTTIINKSALGPGSEVLNYGERVSDNRVQSISVNDNGEIITATSISERVAYLMSQEDVLTTFTTYNVDLQPTQIDFTSASVPAYAVRTNMTYNVDKTMATSQTIIV